MVCTVLPASEGQQDGRAHLPMWGSFHNGTARLGTTAHSNIEGLGTFGPQVAKEHRPSCPCGQQLPNNYYLFECFTPCLGGYDRFTIFSMTG